MRPDPARNLALRRYAKLVAGCTFGLLLAGGMVTSTGSGLAVPDWPLSFGQVMPPMQGGVLYEHGHRMVASAVGLLIVVEALWLARVEPRAWVRRLGWLALAGVVVQGLLGGLTVLLRLPESVSVSHAGVAQLVFGVTVTIALATSRGWLEAAGEGRPLDARTPALATLAAATTVVVYLQILLGAVVRHAGAGLAIPTFPLAYGRLVPPLASWPVRLHYAHRVGALVVALAAGWCALRAWGFRRAAPRVARTGYALAALVVVQIALGGWTIVSHKAAWIATLHLGVGALVFASSLVLAVRARRHVRLAPAPAGALLEPRVVAGGPG